MIKLIITNALCLLLCATYARFDEIRHQGVSLLAAFLTEDSGVPLPVDLQNFVAFQEGFERLFNSTEEVRSGYSK